jgi:hypothetical protein
MSSDAFSFTPVCLGLLMDDTSMKYDHCVWVGHGLFYFPAKISDDHQVDAYTCGYPAVNKIHSIFRTCFVRVASAIWPVHAVST